MAPFHAVELVANASLLVGQATEFRVVAFGDPVLVRCVTALVQDGKLVIGWANRRATQGGSPARGDEIVVTARGNCPRSGDPRRLSVRVAAPAIDQVRLREHGTVAVGAMRVPAFAAILSGRGSMALENLRSAETHLAIPGSGRISATGELGRLSVRVPGRGVVDTTRAEAGSLDVMVGGHGQISATVDGPASGALAGSGVIAVRGRPACAIRATGSGRILCPVSP